MKLTPEQIAALGALKRFWPDTPFVLVGASALGCFLDFHWRTTNDIDVVVSVELDELPDIVRHLSGWAPDPSAEHRWSAPGGVKVDIVPAGPLLRQAGVLRWKRSGNEMTLLGQRLVFERAVDVAVGPALTIKVAPVAVVVVLKMIAYQDQPHTRVRDLADLAHALDDYVEADALRRFEGDAADVAFDLASAYLLGTDIGAIVRSDERRAVVSFLSKVRDERDPHGAQSKMARGAPVAWRNEIDALLARLDAFERGLGAKT